MWAFFTLVFMSYVAYLKLLRFLYQQKRDVCNTYEITINRGRMQFRANFTLRSNRNEEAAIFWHG